MKLLRLETLLIGISLIATAACSPEFNVKDPNAAANKKKKTTAAAPTVGARLLTSVFDPNTSGGGALGTSSGYRLSGVNVGYVVKKVDGTATGYKLKGGANGQLAP